jgi:16S rRNA (adenine1518-N6/adenine1519-N6)-dimethyltransferase
MTVKASLGERGLAPRKRWGQHFLTDPRILESIVDAAQVDHDDYVLEIGPGLGHLTRVLAQHAAHVVAVEVDSGLVEKLHTVFSADSNVVILQGDVLEAEPFEWIVRGTTVEREAVPSYKIVANLPYYITSAILRHVLEAVKKPKTIVVMVQREVAHRILARAPQMNLLAVSVQFFARPKIVKTISAGAFYPRPQVDSAVVRLEVPDRSPYSVQDVSRFFTIVRAGFGERRKQIRNALAHGLRLDVPIVLRMLTSAGIDPMRRAETLTIEEWVSLYHAIEHTHR